MARKEISASKALAIKLIHAALSVLQENDGEMPARELIDAVGQRVELDDWAKGHYEKTGAIRWKSTLNFYSIDCVRAGYLVKKKGSWYLTAEGKEALKLGPTELLESAQQGYLQWKFQQQAHKGEEIINDAAEQEEMTLDPEQIAREGLERQLGKFNPYEFQDLVGALLRGMGYYTPFIAPKGKDGGIDIMAYRDPLGTESPRIQVQIKHREAGASVQEVRQLMGLLQKEGDVGLFVSTGGFTADAKNTARSSHIHVELVDLSRFISLWQEFYEKLPDADKALLPMTPIYFLAKTE
uniref:restriction endonuclease n=1 Tax=Candidatus Electronema sp. TaxID=2698783 RepID=UPI0040577560